MAVKETLSFANFKKRERLFWFKELESNIRQRAPTMEHAIKLLRVSKLKDVQWYSRLLTVFASGFSGVCQ